MTGWHECGSQLEDLNNERRVRKGEGEDVWNHGHSVMQCADQLPTDCKVVCISHGL